MHGADFLDGCSEATEISLKQMGLVTLISIDHSRQIKRSPALRDRRKLSMDDLFKQGLKIVQREN